MKKSKVIITVILSVLIIISPLITLLCTVLFTPKTYSDTFVGALDEKFERLNSVEGAKVVVVGGSSVAFGIDSALMEEHLGMPVVNFGLYAALGTKAMLDLSLSGISAGDIVVLSPELDRQTLSMYFSSEHMLEALDDDYSMARYIRGDNKLALLGGAFKQATKKLSYLRSGLPSPEGVYNSSSLNEYGDVKYEMLDDSGDMLWERRENVMQLYYDPATPIELVPDIVESEFIDYLNEYISICKRRGATVYFSWCPMNRLALSEEIGAEGISLFVDFMESSIDCEFISYIDSYIIDEGYFYDTNYHLNEAGVLLRSKTLTEDILIAEGRFTSVGITVPDAPALPELDVKFLCEDENSKYFTYEKMKNGALMITGLTDEGKMQKTLTIPLGAEHYKVTAIGERAFSGGAAERIIVSADTNIRNFLDGSFADCLVTDLYIYYDFTDEAEKLAPASNFFGINIHVPKNSQYLTHYDWKDTSGGYDMIADINKE